MQERVDWRWLIENGSFGSRGVLWRGAGGTDYGKLVLEWSVGGGALEGGITS